MDSKLFLTTFTTIFLAEMGDKTQLAAVAAGAQSKSILPILIAVVTALGLAGALGVVAGSWIGQSLNPLLTKWVSGSLFIAVGVWTLAK